MATSILNFPTNPQLGDLYTIGTRTYRWTGSAWLVDSSTVAATTLTAFKVHTTSVENINTASIGDFGSLIVDGGASIAKDLYIGGSLYLAETIIITTASFANSPSDGSDIHIEPINVGGLDLLQFNNISTLQSVTGRGNTTTNVVKFLNSTESTSTNTGAVLISGGLGVGKRINSESIQIADTVFDSTKTTVNSTGQYLVDSYSLNSYRSSKYFIQIDEGTTSTARFQSLEIMLLATNTGTAKATEYGLITSDGSLGSFSKDVTGVGDQWIVNLYFTPIDNIPKTIKVLRTAMTV
jgi:hypothetical protein